MAHATLKLDQIRIDGGTQPRQGIDYEVAYSYGDMMAEGVKFPPVTVFYDGSNYWLADGFHRYHAAFSQEIAEIAADVIQGTIEDAQWFSFGANKSHGLMRSNDDKQRAVQAALRHPKCLGLSNRAIAKHVGVSEGSVRAWRERMEPTAKVTQSTLRTGSDGRTINVSNIGKRAAAEEAQIPAPRPIHPEQTPEPEYIEVDSEQTTTSEPEESEDLFLFVRNVRAIVETQLTASLLADEIVSSEFTEQILQEMEKANEFLAAVKASAAARR